MGPSVLIYKGSDKLLVLLDDHSCPLSMPSLITASSVARLCKSLNHKQYVVTGIRFWNVKLHDFVLYELIRKSCSGSIGGR